MIKQFPDECLTKASEPFTDICDMDEAIRLLEGALNSVEAVGIALPQLGINKRAIILNFENWMSFPMINPKIIDSSKFKLNSTESCLSVGGIWTVKRKDWITVEFQTRDRNVTRQKFEKFAASVVQHEIDHLNGILISSHGKEK